MGDITSWRSAGGFATGGFVPDGTNTGDKIAGGT
jgi:hypothetical protein